MAKGDTQKKVEYFDRVRHLFREYNKIFVVNVDNVTSSQMHQIRLGLRDQAVVLMGKNTMVKKAMREVVSENPKLEAILPCIRGNIGLVFTNGDLKAIRDIMVANRIKAPARLGLVAQNDIIVAAGDTGLDANTTSFFQALGIATKIVKKCIEISSDVLLVKTGQKVGASEAALLSMLNITPFAYGLVVEQVYDNGTIYSPDVLDVTTEDLRARFVSGIRNVAAASLQVGYPTKASVPHSIANGFKNLLAVAAVTDVTFKQAEKLKEYLADPSKFAVAAAPAKSAPVAAAPAKEEKKEEPKEESDEDMGFGLFD